MMASPVEFRTYTPADSRADLMRRIEAAPREHAEAILEGYELLQRLHDAKVIAALNGVLGAGETVVAQVVDVVSSKPAIGALRLAVILGGIVTSVNAERVHKAAAEARSGTPSWFSLLRLVFSTDVRRALGLGLSLLNIVGGGLRAEAGTPGKVEI
jgi:uncharacterized protein YjgD (DUF1641 family)